VQIAGLVARRIILEAAVGDQLNVGQQYGIIRFGSRVDVWLPATTTVQVLPGQTMIAGETILADCLQACLKLRKAFIADDPTCTPKKNGSDRYLFSGYCQIC